MNGLAIEELADRTVGQLVVERPGRARVFERFGIDYCCGGKAPLAKACKARGTRSSLRSGWPMSMMMLRKGSRRIGLLLLWRISSRTSSRRTMPF